MVKTCANCGHYGTQVKHGVIIGPSCNGQREKKWAPSVAQKDSRCGTQKLWWIAIDKNTKNRKGSK